MKKKQTNKSEEQREQKKNNNSLEIETEELNEVVDAAEKIIADNDNNVEENGKENAEEIIDWQLKVAELQDKYIRLSAEFDNYRKRTLKEKMDLQKYGSENVLCDMLPLMDDVERAVAAMEKSNDVQSVKDGIELIYSKFLGFLKRNRVTEIEARDCVFDVDVHDAVANFPAADETQKGKIIDVVQKGYYLEDKVIRHAKVVVAE